MFWRARWVMGISSWVRSINWFAPKSHSPIIIIIMIMITIIIKNTFDLGGTVALLLLQDHHTMLPWSVSRLFHNVYNSMTQEKWLRKQERFKFRPERDDGWSSLDLRRQRVPSPSCSHRKSAIADRCAACRWNQRSGCVDRAELSSWRTAGCWTDAFAQVLWDRRKVLLDEGKIISRLRGRLRRWRP